MDTEKLYRILNATTAEYRKGEAVEERQSGRLAVTEIYMMPPVDDAPPEIEKVDVVFEVIGVDKAKAEQHRDDLIGILNDYPQPDRLARGPSYIEVGGVIGSQSGAFRLFALGKVLGLWQLITPATMGFEGHEARDVAGKGFIMITGYRKP